MRFLGYLNFCSLLIANLNLADRDLEFNSISFSDGLKTLFLYSLNKKNYHLHFQEDISLIFIFFWYYC